MKKIALAVFAASMTLGLTLGLAACADKYEKAGFVVEQEDGRLWVFKEGSEHLAQFEKTGEPAKQYTAIGAGPEGQTVKAADKAVLDEYLALVAEGK